MTDDRDRYATPDGPLSETTLSCPFCAFAATGETRDVAQRKRWRHVRESHPEGDHVDIAAQLKRHDKEAGDE